MAELVPVQTLLKLAAVHTNPNAPEHDITVRIEALGSAAAGHT